MCSCATVDPRVRERRVRLDLPRPGDGQRRLGNRAPTPLGIASSSDVHPLVVGEPAEEQDRGPGRQRLASGGLDPVRDDDDRRRAALELDQLLAQGLAVDEDQAGAADQRAVLPADLRPTRRRRDGGRGRGPSARSDRARRPAATSSRRSLPIDSWRWTTSGAGWRSRRRSRRASAQPGR